MKRFYNRRGMSPLERAQLENALAEAAAAREAQADIETALADASAITDYNLMMGNLEDPSEDDEEEEE